MNQASIEAEANFMWMIGPSSTFIKLQLYFMAAE